ncbi:hypothetical protein [Ascidiaceihabitans sp.]|uniref:DMP19 family protein n=1 Tax=Ascidiaceihabitans sp. TaxID=1872644 RepID=UPI003296EEF7
MSHLITQIPVRLSVYEDPISEEIGYEAWNVTHDLMFGPTAQLVSQRIRNAYAVGYYAGQISNGGHSQLLYNMDIQQKRSDFLMDDFQAGVQMMLVPSFAGIAADFKTWITENPNEAFEQTGFNGGRGEFLDELDDRFHDYDRGYKEALSQMLVSSSAPLEKSFIEECVQRKGNWTGDLSAFETIWWLRSGVLRPVPDCEFQNAVRSLLQDGD